MPRSVRFYTRRPTTSGRIVLFLLEVFRPILFLLGFVSRLCYRVAFSWWLNPLFDRWIQNGFAEEIKHQMPFLFGLYGYGCKVVEDPRPDANDESMEYICIASPSLIFKFRRWRRENYGIQVAPTFAPTEFFDLLDALNLVDAAVDPERLLPEARWEQKRMLDTSWRPWGQLLEPRFQLLERAFGMENFQVTKDTLAS